MSKLATIEQLKKLALRSKAEIDKVDGKVTDLSGKVDELVTAGGEPNKIEIIKVNGTAQAVTGKAVDLSVPTQQDIADAVAAAGHLQRRKADSVDAIDPAAEGADKFIYMVPKTGSDADDLYDEYMVLDGKVEHVGNTKVSLDGYQQKEDGKGLSANDFTDEYKAKLDGIGAADDTEIDSMLDEVFGPAETPAA